MQSRIAIFGGVLATVLLAAPTLTGQTAREHSATSGSSSVERVEPFARLNAMRIPPLAPSKWTDAHREVLGPQGGPTQMQVCLHNLDLCRKYWTFARQLTSHYTLPLRDKELLILRTTWLSRGEYVWGRHSTGSGARAGITEEELVRITQGPEANEWSDFDAVLLQAADELHTSRFIADAAWKSLAERYDEGQLLEVMFVVGNYALLTMFHNSVGLPLEPGIEGLEESLRIYNHE